METKRLGSLADQLTLERLAITKGRDRYLDRKARLNNLALDKAHGQVMDEAIVKVAEALKVTVSKASDSSALGRKFSWVDDLAGLDLDLLAYMGLSTCMESVSLNESRTKCLRRIGERVEMEYWALGLKEYDKKLAKRVESVAVNNNSSHIHRRKAALSVAKKGGYEPERWTEERKIKAAAPIYNVILETSGVFETWVQTKAEGKTVYKVGLTTQASDRIAEIDMEASWHQPILGPMVVQPKGWDALEGGCYIDPAMSEFTPLVRHASGLQRKLLKAALDSGRLQPALDAINAVQRTPYCINTYVLDAVHWAWDNAKEVNGFPMRSHVPDPVYPDNYDDLDDFEKKGWKLKSRETRDFNRKVDSDRAMMAQDLTTAMEMQEYDHFFIPHNFDFRGRVYPIPVFNHHREDHIRSMFYFSRSKPVDQDALQWIAFQCANTGDFEKISKRPVAERIQWVEDNQEWLLRVGEDFEATYPLWKDADKPFAFLAACRELYRYSVEGDDYVSGLPINLDGSNSGVQHFAALGKCENDGRLVNLVPMHEPQDIYQTVADEVAQELAQSDDTSAKEWINFGIGRKLVKRNVMTFGYSATQFGFREQIIVDTLDPLKRDVSRGSLPVFPFSDKVAAASVLAKANWKAVNNVVTGARDGMEFFRKLSDLLSHRGKAVTWNTPIGFPVVNYYRPITVKRLKIYLFDRDAAKPTRSSVSVATEQLGKIDKKKSKAAISPNVIHSLDSSHLMSTVLDGLQEGIRDFMLIHDSFATTPADTWKLFHSVRRTFVEQYQDTCVYETILRDATKVLRDDKVELPPIPKKGDLDLSGVLTSMYCFA